MERVEGFGVFDEVGRFPGGLVPTDPLDVVLKLLGSTEETGVEDLLNEVFFETVDDDRRRWRDDLAGVRVADVEGQLGDVEDRVALHGRRKVEMVGVRAYDLEDREGTKAFMIQLLRRANGTDVAGVEPDLVTNLEVWCGSSVVVSILLMLKLGTSDFGTEVVEDGGHGGLDLFGIKSGRVGRVRKVGGCHTGVASVVGEEGGHAGGLRGGVVAGELGEGKERLPVVLLVTDKRPEVLFHDGVHAFGLAISLWVEGGRESAVHDKTLAEGEPELSGELGASVGDDGVGQAVEAEDVLDEQIGKVAGGAVGAAGDEVGHLGEAVDDNEDGVESVRPWEARDEVHGDVAPWEVRDREWAQDSEGRVTGGTVALADVAAVDVAVNVFPHLGPPVGSGRELNGLCTAGVACHEGIVVCLHDVQPEGFVFGDVEAFAEG